MLLTVFIAGIQSVASVHLKFALSHLLGLFDLVLGELDNGRWVRLSLWLPGGLRLLVLVSLLLVISGLLGSSLLCNL